MRKWLLVGVCLITGVAVFLLLRSQDKNPSPGSKPISASGPGVTTSGRSTNSQSAARLPAPAVLSTGTTPSPSVAEKAGAPGSNSSAAPPISTAPEFSDVAPSAVMENVRRTFRDYASVFGGNPVGTNPEITQALNGGNPKQTRFLRPEEGLRVNEKGEMVDPWGTPFFFHQLSARVMEIHSAGPDRRMWTADDLVTK
jgi:hypothetical protein